MRYSRVPRQSAVNTDRGALPSTIPLELLETRDVDFGDYALKILKELDRLDKKDA